MMMYFFNAYLIMCMAFEPYFTDEVKHPWRPHYTPMEDRIKESFME